MQVDFRDLPGREAYRWLAATITPRPIAWISTRSRHGVDNLAPISFFNVICDAPPTFVVAVTPRADGSPKDTLRNAQDTGELVLQLPSRALAEAMNASSASLPPETSEFERFGIASQACELMSVRRVAGAPVAFECKVAQIMQYPAHKPSRHLIFAEALLAHYDEAVLADARHVDPHRLDTVGRLGGNNYTTTRDIFSMIRPD
ncbi:MAG: flavin reductase family protein [Pseudoxanthomonas sp.]